jgi:NADH-quinone oxidoreductase subunit J
MLDAEFLAAVQLVVYAGGILVLIIFGIMLTGSAEGAQRPRWWEWARGLTVAAIIAGGLAVALWPSHARFAEATAGNPAYGIASLGVALLGEFLVPFELLSVLLLVVMIGAAYLARSRRRPRATLPDPS